MNNELKFLGEKILQEKQRIAENVHKHIQAHTENPRTLAITEKEIIDIRSHFIGLFGTFLIEQPDENTAKATLFKWAQKTGSTTYHLGVSLEKALGELSSYRHFIWELLRKEMLNNDMSLKTSFQVDAFLNPLLDYAVYCFSLTYVQFHEKTLKNAKNAFLELSVPVVPITKGIAILPLIGNIDTERARLLMEEVLIKAAKLKLSYLLFDLSGVEIVDTMVADKFFKVDSALRLVGVQTIFIGIRPEVAQTMVALGINIDTLKVEANLEQALKKLGYSNSFCKN